MRMKLTPRELWLIKAGRNTFLFCQAVPPLLYYLRYSDKSPRFPATISHTIRKGLPRWFHHFSWILGWGLTCAGMYPSSNRAIRIFVTQMVLTGIVCVMLFPLGSGGTSALKIHYVTAIMYMADHFWLAEILNENAIYRITFKLCFVGMVFCAILSTRIKKGKDLDSDDESVDGEVITQGNGRNDQDRFANMLSRLSLVCVGGPKALLYPFETKQTIQKKELNNIIHWYLKLLVMLTENGLFTSFVLGMASGLRQPNKLLAKK